MSCLRLLDMWCWVAGQVTWPRHVQHQQRSRGPQARQVAYVVRQVGPSILGAAVTVGWKATTARRVHEAVQWYIYIYITYIYAYMYICILCHMCIYIYIYIDMHKYMFYQCIMYVQYIYIYIYICIRLNYIIYIDSEYLHYTYNTIYTIHSAQYRIHKMQYAICNVQDKTSHQIRTFGWYCNDIGL